MRKAFIPGGVLSVAWFATGFVRALVFDGGTSFAGALMIGVLFGSIMGLLVFVIMIVVEMTSSDRGSSIDENDLKHEKG